MKLIIDTHAFIWFDAAPAQLSSRAAQLISDPNNDVILSIVSIWEMVIKAQIGKLKLRDQVQTLVQDHVARNAIHLLDVNVNHAYAVVPLPMIHKDPFDRLLIAQAIVENATLLTNDPMICQYAVSTDW